MIVFQNSRGVQFSKKNFFLSCIEKHPWQLEHNGNKSLVEKEALGLIFDAITKKLRPTSSPLM